VKYGYIKRFEIQIVHKEICASLFIKKKLVEKGNIGLFCGCVGLFCGFTCAFIFAITKKMVEDGNMGSLKDV